jgi:hypothetical protein
MQMVGTTDTPQPSIHEESVMSNIEPCRSVIVRPSTTVGTLAVRRQALRTARALAAIEHRALARTAEVQAEGFVAGAKVHELDALAREAVTGQAMLANWRDTVAGGDVLLADELRMFTDVARLGKGEILADTVSTFCRER